MMKANEARELTVKALTEQVEAHLPKIEEKIIREAKQGDYCIYYYNNITDLDPRAKSILIQQLKDAGYTTRWNTASLVISWTE